MLLESLRDDRRAKWILRGVSLFTVLLTWEFFGRRAHPIILPPFSSVVKAWGRILASGEILVALKVTLTTLAVGFGLALVVSLLVGMFMGRHRKIEEFLMPYITIALVVPMITLIPLLVMWFGLGMASRVAVVFFFCAIYMTVNVAAGVKSTDVSLAEMARAFGADERALFLKIRFPSALPLTMAGIRLGLGRAFVGVITAEMIIAVVGLGDILMLYGANYDTAALFSTILTILVAAVVLLQGVEYVDRKLIFWKT